MKLFGDTFIDKKVLITGHTGFKGSWLTMWLNELGANVIGISDKVFSSPSLFEDLSLEGDITHHLFDIRNEQKLKKVIHDTKPDFIFHLAAQAIVSESYIQPIDTITTNVVGTANLLSALTESDWDCVSVIITSDKCYENNEWVWGYRETDHMGGKDIYSASKGSAELIFSAFFQSFFKNHKSLKIATARAGNVIGGGDWSKDRIVADAMRAWGAGQSLAIRSPNATRPWQHVLEPLSGYLRLAQSLKENPQLSGEQFNFGPKAENVFSVSALLDALQKDWEFEKDFIPYLVQNEVPFNEASLLKLNCDKAHIHLSWEPILEFKECTKFVNEWYKNFFEKKIPIRSLSESQINQYCNQANAKQAIWSL